MKFKRADCILCVLVLLCAGLALLPRLLPEKKQSAVIYCNGAVYQSIPLPANGEPYSLQLGDPAVTITVTQDAIAFTHAACPDQLCVQAGQLRHSGQTAACLPAKVVIVIRGGSGPDAITY